MENHDYQARRHYFFPRTSREAFGSEMEPLRSDLTFGYKKHHSVWLPTIVLSILIALLFLGAK